MVSPPLASWTTLHTEFRRAFGSPPTLYARAPGRVNLIGEHTDYNGGLVLPAAVYHSTLIAARPSTAPILRIRSIALADQTTILLDQPTASDHQFWERYAAGVVHELRRLGIALRGGDLLVGGDLPIGAGLSSSAAFEVACALVLLQFANASLPMREVALSCWRAETEFVGVPCGIMDQFACALSVAGHALFLDCRSQTTHHLPLPPSLRLAVCDTGIRRSVASSAYHVRREECAAAVRALQSRGRAIGALRDLGLDDLPLIEQLPAPLNRRARHVVTENARVLEVTRALTGGTIEALQGVFQRSHRSLREDYEVSCPELDAMVAAALGAPGCVAARMTGAGFGGAVIALLETDDPDAFVQATSEAYLRAAGTPGTFFISPATAGAELAPAADIAGAPSSTER